MQITLQYFDGCPNWKKTAADLEALRAEGLDIQIFQQFIENHEAAAAAGFRGSPTVIIDGVDPFADPDAPIGLACRIYRSAAGTAGSPSRDQLRKAVAAAAGS